LYRESTYPLVSDLPSRTWATLLELPEEGDTDRPVLLHWLAPDATAPPRHVHPDTETFESLRGELTVVVEEEAIRLSPGESATVQPGREHAFRNDTDGIVAFRAELPSLRIIKGLYTTWGVTHERARSDGELRPGDFGGLGPSALRALLVSEDLYPETVMSVGPVSVQRGLWATVGRLARRLGNTGVEDRFLREEFWTGYVEQPQFADRR
jgi:quercetin dioxygenase-like cupin family protein